MNREIKFRAWNKEHGVMSQPLDVFHVNNVAWLDVDIMQFTGLKDRSLKEIYEGDIVKIADSDSITGEVYYQIPYAAFLIDSTKWGGSGKLPLVPKAIEVIGNIYENPELLK